MLQLAKKEQETKKKMLQLAKKEQETKKDQILQLAEELGPEDRKNSDEDSHTRIPQKKCRVILSWLKEVLNRDVTCGGKTMGLGVFFVFCILALIAVIAMIFAASCCSGCLGAFLSE